MKKFYLLAIVYLSFFIPYEVFGTITTTEEEPNKK